MKKIEIEVINFIKFLKKNNKNIIIPSFNIFFLKIKRQIFQQIILQRDI